MKEKDFELETQTIGNASDVTETGGLTLESLNAVVKLIPPRKIVVGIACCPQVAERLKQFTNPVYPSWGVPLLIDPRLTMNNSEVYYDEEAWRARCAEQNKWDSMEVASALPNTVTTQPEASVKPKESVAAIKPKEKE